MKLVIVNRKGEKFTCLYSSRDHHLVAGRKWHLEAGYVTRRGTKTNGKQPVILLHRLILGTVDSSIFTDHKNRNRLDNRRSNLRVCNYSQNRANSPTKKYRKGASKYRGVTFPQHPRAGGKTVRLIRADIRIKKVKKNLGYFKTEFEAALAYDTAAIQEYGEFAFLNFPKK